MSLDEKRPIIIKKVKKGGHGAHGGAWKIAYADFVTAMMAFFLLMWLLGSTTQADLQGIAEYFQNPLKVSLMGGSGAGDATSIIQGGGGDLSRSTGQVRRTQTGTREIVTRVSEESTGRLSQLGKELKELVEDSPVLKKYKNQLKIELTRDGLRIQIIDDRDRPMFAAGSDRMESYAREIIAEITPLLAKLPNRISITGHTDAVPYGPNDRGYTNWELSADRANAARRELIRDGLSEDRVIRVTGLAAVVPLDRANPNSPSNRRIALIVLNKEAEEALLMEQSSELEVGETTVEPDVPAPEPPPAPPPEEPAALPPPEPNQLNPVAAPRLPPVPTRVDKPVEQPSAPAEQPVLPPRRNSELNPIRPPSLPAIPGADSR